MRTLRPWQGRCTQYFSPFFVLDGLTLLSYPMASVELIGIPDPREISGIVSQAIAESQSTKYNPKLNRIKCNKHQCPLVGLPVQKEHGMDQLDAMVARRALL